MIKTVPTIQVFILINIGEVMFESYLLLVADLGESQSRPNTEIP